MGGRSVLLKSAVGLPCLSIMTSICPPSNGEFSSQQPTLMAMYSLSVHYSLTHSRIQSNGEQAITRVGRKNTHRPTVSRRLTTWKD